MALTKVQAEGINLADTFAFTGAITGVGVSNLQMFRINAEISSTTSPTTITAYTDAHDSSGFKRIGTAWSVSSGVFTPSVSGLYEIMLIADLKGNAAARYVQFDNNYSTNSGGSYSTHTYYAAMPYLNSSTTYSNFTIPRYYNITDASTFRFRIKYSAENTSIIIRGGSDNSVSLLMFKRLADAQ